MRTLLLLLTLVIPLQSIACKDPLRFQVGPFFSTGSVIKLWADFVNDVEKSTGCSITIVASESFDEYLKDIASQKSDMYMKLPQ